MKILELEIKSSPSELRFVEQNIHEALVKCLLTKSEINEVSLALIEAVGNAIKHGNKNDKSKKVTILIECSPESLRAKIKDEGLGFDPHAIEDPTKPENLLKTCGRGLFIMKHIMNSCNYDFSKQGTTLTLEYNLKKIKGAI